VAKATDSPVILQASRGARSYAGDIFLRHLFDAAVEMYPDIPICIHQDHGNNFDTCLSAMANNFTSVMMDGSLEEDAKTPASYEYNVGISSKVTEVAHKIGVSVEGELGCLGSLETGEGEKEDGHGFEGKLSQDQLLTDPDQATDFVKKTQVDALAVAIGTSHGAYKFSRKPDGDILALNVVKAINKRLPGLHTWLCTAQVRSRKNYRTLSMQTAGKCLRPGARLWTKLLRASNMVSGKLISILIVAWRFLVKSGKYYWKRKRSLIHANSQSRRLTPCRWFVNHVMNRLGRQAMHRS